MGAYFAIFFLVTSLQSMELITAHACTHAPLTCALDELLFEELIAHVDQLIQVVEPNLPRCAKIHRVCVSLKGQLSDEGMMRHRTILIPSVAAHFIVALKEWWSASDVYVDPSDTYRDFLISQWDAAADQALIAVIREQSSLRFPKKRADHACFIDLNKDLSEDSIEAPLTAAILGSYYVRQLNRNRAESLFKYRHKYLSSATKSEIFSYTGFESCP